MAIFPRSSKSITKDQVAFRHPVINPRLKTVPDTVAGMSNLVISDIGRIWFSRFSGQFSPDGSPIYKAPVPIRAEGFPLALDELPVISPGMSMVMD